MEYFIYVGFVGAVAIFLPCLSGDLARCWKSLPSGESPACGIWSIFADRRGKFWGRVKRERGKKGLIASAAGSGENVLWERIKMMGCVKERWDRGRKYSVRFGTESLSASEPHGLAALPLWGPGRALGSDPAP